MRRFVPVLLILCLLVPICACAQHEGDTVHQSVSETTTDEHILPSAELPMRPLFSADFTSEPTVTEPPTEFMSAPLTESTAHVHAFVDEVIAATCTEPGYTRRVCACGETIRTAQTEPLGHAFGAPQVLIPSTCTANGTQKLVCTRCGFAQTETAPRAPHDLTAWITTQNATENLPGEEQCRCKVCGYTIRRTIPARGSTLYADVEEAKQMLDLVNASRAEAGVRPLAFDYDRYVCAEIRAREAAENFSHTRPDGTDFITVVAEQHCAAPTAWAENLQYSTDPANALQNAHDMLMNSPGHRENLLSATYATVAICVLRSEKGTYIAELFFA